jgi:hypothetical protein
VTDGDYREGPTFDDYPCERCKLEGRGRHSYDVPPCDPLSLIERRRLLAQVSS